MAKPLAFIIEDDPQLNEIMSITLQADFDVETCVDGDLAIVRLKNIVPRIIILDLNLPGRSGRDVLTYIHSDERFKKTRVILTTADGRQAEILRNEADIVLLKPISPRQLQELALRVSSMQ
jgi:DNA-binding response OmpR family regulator